MNVQGEIGFSRAKISNIVLVIEEHSNDSLGKHVSQEGGQKWQYFREATQEQVARVGHCLQV